MKKLLLIVIMLASYVCTYATCGYCNGNGRVKTHVGMSGFGINNEKFKCPHCGKWVFKTEDHWDTCPQCHGNPNGNDRSSRQDDRDNGAGSDPYILYLSSAEYSDWKNCIDLAMRGGIKMVDCPDCNGSGRCRVCNGSGLSPLQHPDDMEFFGMHTPCPQCGTSGNCQRCFGSRQISVPDESIKETANKRLEYYRDLVTQRMEEHNRNNGYLPFDNNNQEGGSRDSDYGNDDYNPHNGNQDKNSGKHSSKNMLIGLVACICVGGFIFLRRRR